MSNSILSSVVRAMSILKLFHQDQKELSFMQIVHLTNLPKSSVHRLIKSLKNEGFLTQNPRNGYYRLGLDLLGLGGVIYSRHKLYQEAFPLVKELAHQLEESLHICFLENEEVTYLFRVESPYPDKLVTQIGRKNPFHCTSEGLCIYAYQKDYTIESVLETERYAYTNRTLTTKHELMSEFQKIRRNGYCIAEDTYFHNYTSIAAPIRNHMGDVVSSLSTIGQTERFHQKGTLEIALKIKSYAKKISQHLGYY